MRQKDDAICTGVCEIKGASARERKTEKKSQIIAKKSGRGNRRTRGRTIANTGGRVLPKTEKMSRRSAKNRESERGENREKGDI